MTGHLPLGPRLHILICPVYRDNGTKEAVIKFTTDSAASTACLLNNALVDGSNIRVEMFPSEEERPGREGTPASQKSAAGATNDSFTSIFSGLASSSRSLVSSMAGKVKELDQQYGVSETIVAGASTAWSESKRLASDIDNKYHVKDTVSSAVQSTKEKVMGVGKAGSPQPAAAGATGGSPKGTPPSSPRPGSPSKF